MDKPINNTKLLSKVYLFAVHFLSVKDVAFRRNAGLNAFSKNRQISITLIATWYKICVLLCLAFLLTGCSDMIEVQERDFILALGVSFKEDKYELTFAFQDLSAADEADKGQTRTYKAGSLAEIEDLYNNGSNRWLDYRHLEALIFDETINAAADKPADMFEYFEDNYEISRNVQVFYYSGDVKTLIEAKAGLGGGIGNYLKRLTSNNQRKTGLPAVTLGSLMDSFYEQRGILIPLLELKEDKLEVNGAAVFREKISHKLSGEELNICHLIKGEGSELSFHNPSVVFKLREFRSDARYFYRNSKPSIELTITGTADILSEADGNDIGNYLKDAVLSRIDDCKEQGLDYLGFYDESSIKNRDIWLSYQNRREDFINDAEFEVVVDITHD